MGSGVILMLVVNVWGLLRFARRGAEGRRGFTYRYLHANLRMLAIMSWGMGVLFAVITLLPVLSGDTAQWIFLGVLVLPLALLAVTLLPLMKLSEVAAGETDQTRTTAGCSACSTSIARIRR